MDLHLSVYRCIDLNLFNPLPHTNPTPLFVLGKKKNLNRRSKLAARKTQTGELLWELPLELGVVSSPVIGKLQGGAFSL